MKTIDPTTGKVFSDDTSTVTTPAPIIPTTPAIIAIPPQIAQTLVWVAVGFGLCYWLLCRRDRGFD